MAKMSFNKIGSEHKVFVSLLFIGLIFRLIFIECQGLSNDELSAWYRTRFAMGEEFITKGVSLGDMHPVFYQGLLWIWVRVFGDGDFSLRATSLLFFVLNLSLIYKIAIRFFSKYTGNLIVAFYSVLGFLIVHTTTARPYNSGVFFLLLCFYLILTLQETEGRKQLRIALFLFLSMFGAMISHYFAFLSVGLLSVVALFYVSKEKRKFLIVSGSTALLVFSLTHLQITLEQLSHGGLGWLGKPSFFWFVEFTKLLFQNSWLMFLLGGMLILFAKRRSTSQNAAQGFSLAVMLVISIVAYLLSVFYTPILRELVFQFILPFSFFGLLGPIHSLENNKRSGKVHKNLPWIIVLIFGLHSVVVYKVFEPIHYGVFRELAKNQNKLEDKYLSENITTAQNSNNYDYLNYYLKSTGKREVITDWSNPETVYQLYDRIKTAKTDYFLYNWTNNYHVPMYVECIRREFPFQLQKEDYFNSGIRFFSKKQKSKLPIKSFVKTLTLGGAINKEEFAFETFVSVGDLREQIGEMDYLLIEAFGEVKNAKEFFIITVAVDENKEVIMQGEFPLLYRGYNQQMLVPENGEKEMFSAFTLLKELKDTDQLKFYCWNPNKGKVVLNKIKLYAIK